MAYDGRIRRAKDSDGIRDRIPLTELFGHHTAILEIKGLVTSGEHRVVTVTGPGGIGKTRLAVEVVKGLRGTRKAPAIDAVMVALAPIGDAGLVLPTIAG